ncbi:MAG: N-acetylneuraminate synthase family protein [Lachnospiraceae bacterium]|nr:N-acetylneuraminate synthase family protein [Lachnospiraceae bacterium]MBP3595245.1 N-acetylneuraminate synthase family protein [Lachnospiraceae bacterium]
MKELIIGGKKVSNNSRTLIIAEAGINHDGKYDQALQLIDVAVAAKADIVKFQLFRADKMYTPNAGDYTTAAGQVKPINEILKGTELPYEWIPKLMQYCDSKGIGFLCTVCDEDGADILNNQNVDSFKMASYAITHIPLLKHVAKYKKPVIFSSAGAYLSDVDIAIRAISEVGNDKIGLMHCVAKYPTPLSECNLRIIQMYKQAFPNVIIGYSDHTEDPVAAPVTAVALGAKIIEKHFTIDKNLPGADHSFAVNPEQLAEMCLAIRKVENMSDDEKQQFIHQETLGTSQKMVIEVEENLRKYAYRCVFATEDLRAGDVISTQNTAILRPGNESRGIEPIHYEMLLNNHVRVVKAVKKGCSIKWEDILTMD